MRRQQVRKVKQRDVLKYSPTLVVDKLDTEYIIIDKLYLRRTKVGKDYISTIRLHSNNPILIGGMNYEHG